MKTQNKMAAVLLLLIGIKLYCQVYSQIDYNSTTNIDIGTGADVCADVINITGTFSGSGTICQGPLPVTLSSFTSQTTKNDVLLVWKTETELNNKGFELERKSEKENTWSKIAFIQGSGTTIEQKEYSFKDIKLKAGTYHYRLKQIDFNSNYEYFELESPVLIAPPGSYKISQNYPNPSNPKSKIDYEIPFDSKVSIRVYNLLGQQLKELVNEFKPSDFYTAEFDGTDLASGIYFYRITAEGTLNGRIEKYSKTLKLVLVK